MTAHDELHPVPAEAIEALEQVRAMRARSGLPGHVDLRIHDSPGKPFEWAILVGDCVVRRSPRPERVR